MEEPVNGTQELPPNKVVVRGGKVVRIEEWCLWNLVPTNTFEITRDADGKITCLVTDPEHGGGVAPVRSTDPEEAIPRLHPTVRAKYIAALNAVNPTAEQLKEILGGRPQVTFEA